MTVSPSTGTIAKPWARKVIPRKSVTRIAPSHTRTARAFCASGARKAGTPSETASIPVSAAQPEAKARSARNRVRSAVPVSSAGPAAGVPAAPSSHRTPPQPIMRR